MSDSLIEHCRTQIWPPAGTDARLTAHLEEGYGGKIASVSALDATVYAIDCLVNAMINPMFMLAGGGVITFALASRGLREPIMPDGSARSIDSLADGVPPRRLHPGYA